MAQYVTREEYDALVARLAALEGRTGVTVTVAADGDDRVLALIREGIAQAEDNRRRGGDFHRRYASQKG